MKYFAILFILLLAVPGFLSAQGFEFISDELEFSGEPGTFFDHYADIINTGSSPINLTIIRTQNDVPNENWLSALCIGDLCFAFNVDTVDAALFFGSLEPDSSLDFHVQVTTDPTVGGTLVMTVLVENQDNLSETQELTFTFSTESSSIGDELPGAVSAFQLSQNFPNPFNPSTQISVQLATASDIQLKIYDALGREIRKLADGLASAGINEFSWDGRDYNGHLAPSGVYYYQLSADGVVQAKKMMLVR